MKVGNRRAIVELARFDCQVGRIARHHEQRLVQGEDKQAGSSCSGYQPRGALDPVAIAQVRQGCRSRCADQRGAALARCQVRTIAQHCTGRGMTEPVRTSQRRTQRSHHQCDFGSPAVKAALRLGQGQPGEAQLL